MFSQHLLRITLIVSLWLVTLHVDSLENWVSRPMNFRRSLIYFFQGHRELAQAFARELNLHYRALDTFQQEEGGMNCGLHVARNVLRFTRNQDIYRRINPKSLAARREIIRARMERGELN